MRRLNKSTRNLISYGLGISAVIFFLLPDTSGFFRLISFVLLVLFVLFGAVERLYHPARHEDDED